MHWNHKILFLKGPGQPHLCLFLREFDHYILFGHVEAKEISETNIDENIEENKENIVLRRWG